MSKPYEKRLIPGEGWCVVEVPTDQIITASFSDNGSSAKKTANFLNGGNGFNGWTPPFILRGIQ